MRSQSPWKRSRMTFRIRMKKKKKQNKRKTNNQETYSQFLSNPLPGCCRVRDHRGHNKVLFFSCRESQGRKSSTQMKTSLLSVFYFSPKKKAQTQTPFLRVCVILLFVHPLISCSLQMQSVHMGIIKTNNALLLIPHILLKSSVIFFFSFFFCCFFLLKHIAVSFKTFFPHREKKSVILFFF